MRKLYQLLFTITALLAEVGFPQGAAALTAAGTVYSDPSGNLIGSGCLNIVSFGGVGNGTTNNSAAWAAAKAALPSGGGCIFFPTGKFLFSSSINYSLSSSTASLRVVGNGENATILYFSGTDGLSVTYNNYMQSVHIEDLSITTGTAGLHNGLTLAQGNSTCLGTFAQSSIVNVLFRGDDNLGGGGPFYWNVAYIVYNLSAVNVISAVVYGDGADHGIGGYYYGSGVGPCFAIYGNVTSSIFNNLSVGILYGQYFQGLTVSQTNFQDAFAISANPGEGGFLAQMNLIGNQLSGDLNAVDIETAIDHIEIIGNVILTTAGNSGIFMTQNGGGGIVSNIIYGAANSFGVYVQNSNGNGLTITSNQFQTLRYGVYLDTTTSKVNVQSNSYVGVTTQVLNNAGTANTVGGGSK